jgi:hypothetical protein
MKVLEESWNRFKKVIPINAGREQVADMRGAFYAGAMVLFETLLQGCPRIAKKGFIASVQSSTARTRAVMGVTMAFTRHRCSLKTRSQAKKPVESAPKSSVGPFHTCIRCEKIYVCDDVKCTGDKGLCTECRPIIMAKVKQMIEAFLYGSIRPGGTA